MNCANYQNQLEDFLYGELDAAAAKTLTEHLFVCADCSQVKIALEQEAEIFSQFYEENALEPSDELWTNIHARIAEENVTASQANWLQKLQDFFGGLLAPALLRQLAFTLLLVVLTAITTLYFATRKNSNTLTATNHETPTPSTKSSISATPNSTPDAPTPAPATNEKTVTPKLQYAAVKTPALTKPEKVAAPPTKLTDEQLLSLQIGKATREYQGAIRLLERAVAKRKSDLDEGTIKQFEGSLALIDASIESSRQALREHPNDPAAGRYLLAAYSRKVELMQEIAMR